MIITDQMYRRLVGKEILNQINQPALPKDFKECLTSFSKDICNAHEDKVHQLNECNVKWAAGFFLTNFLMACEDEYLFLLQTKSKLEKFVLTRYLRKYKKFIDELKSFIDETYSF